MTGGSSPLLVIGSVNYDLIFRHRRLPRAGETLTGAELFESCGGKGANQAVAAARCRGGLRGTPAAVCFVGAVGDDIHGAAQRRVFADDGLDTKGLLILPDIHTGLSAVWVEAGTGDNRILNAPGANTRLTSAGLSAAPIEEAGLLLIQNETPAEGVLSVVARAASAAVPVIWNPAPLDETNDPGLDPAQIAWVTPNEVECAALLGRAGERIDADTAVDAATDLLARGFGGVALTLGAAGVLFAEARGHPRLIAAPTVTPADTTGAGDAFNGAFAAALLAGVDAAGAAAFAVRYASDSVTRSGTQTSFARW